MRSRHAPYGLPETYAQCAYQFGWRCHQCGIGETGNPFAPGSDEHEAYGDAQRERDQAIREDRLLLLGEIKELCPL